MLFKVTDIKGVDRWINPTYVRLLRSRKNKTEIWVAGNTTAIITETPMDDVAMVVNAAQPQTPPPPADQAGSDPDTAALMTILAVT